MTVNLHCNSNFAAHAEREFTMMNHKEITDKLEEIFVYRLKKRAELFKDENFDQPLTGKLFQFTDVDLVYFFLEIERVFEINISGEDVLNNRFSTINGILEIISENLSSC